MLPNFLLQIKLTTSWIPGKQLDDLGRLRSFYVYLIQEQCKQQSWCLNSKTAGTSEKGFGSSKSKDSPSRLFI